MARLSRKLRVCKWAGTVGCVLIVGAWAFSPKWMIAYWASRPDGSKCVSIHVFLVRGQFEVGYTVSDLDRERPQQAESGWDISNIYLCPWREQLGLDWPRLRSYSGTRFPTFDYLPPSKTTEFSLPLWLPFLALLIPTLLLWRRERKPRRGHCRRCDYDLTGNVSGVCPECGTAITGEQRAISSQPAEFQRGVVSESAAVKRSEE